MFDIRHIVAYTLAAIAGLCFASGITIITNEGVHYNGCN